MILQSIKQRILFAMFFVVSVFYYYLNCPVRSRIIPAIKILG